MIDIKKMLRYDEGEKFTAYLCPAHKLTVGVGHNLDADPAFSILERTVQFGDKITQDESSKLLDYDIQKVLKGLNKNLPYFDDLSEKYRVVLINMAFNIGIGGVLAFTITLANMRAGNDVGVVYGLKNSAYYKQVTKRANRMISIINGIIPKVYL